MSNQFESNSANAKNSLNQSEFPVQPDRSAPSSINDSAIASYRNERFVPPPDQVAASQAQLDKLGYGNFSLSTDSQLDVVANPPINPDGPYVDSNLVKEIKAEIISSDTPEQHSYTAISKNEAGASVLGPYKLDSDSLISWIGNLSKDELAALPKMGGGIPSEAAVLTKLNILSQAYKQGLTPDQAHEKFGWIVSDPDVSGFMVALSSMVPGAQVDAATLSKIFSPELQELIAGDMIRADIQSKNASSASAGSVAPVETPSSTAAAPLNTKDNSVLPGPLQ